MKSKMNLWSGICLMSSIIALGIFIPWFKIMKMSVFLEALMGILCLILIGDLILFIAPFMFVLAQITSIISYLYILIIYRKIKISKKTILLLTLLLVPNIIFYKDVYSIYHAIFTLDWWENASYFKWPF